MERIPVLLDTDVGSDVDDALALAYLCRKPECELVGITTVTGDVRRRAAIAEIVCRAYGRPETPIVCGISETLADGPGQPHVPHYEAVAHLPHSLNRPTDCAVDFLRETIRSRPGEIVLLSIGPFTNLAVLFALDPEIPHLLKGIVSMAGSFLSEGKTEWNCACDPVAADAVFRRSKNHLLVGLDVTTECRLEPRETRSRFAEPPHDLLLAMAETWLSKNPRVTFHDPLAAALVFNPSLCRYQPCEVLVNPNGTGETFIESCQNPRHQIATEVDPTAFFTEYFTTLAG